MFRRYIQRIVAIEKSEFLPDESKATLQDGLIMRAITSNINQKLGKPGLTDEGRQLVIDCIQISRHEESHNVIAMTLLAWYRFIVR